MFIESWLGGLGDPGWVTGFEGKVRRENFSHVNTLNAFNSPAKEKSGRIEHAQN